ncbi:MAG: hypothetical protein ACK4P4_22355 [Allorhizobium sp.]
MTDAVSIPRRQNTTDKRAVTDAAAQAIIDQETAEREEKTERLRALRLGQAVAPADESDPGPDQAVS